MLFDAAERDTRLAPGLVRLHTETRRCGELDVRIDREGNARDLH